MERDNFGHSFGVLPTWYWYYVLHINVKNRNNPHDSQKTNKPGIAKKLRHQHNTDMPSPKTIYAHVAVMERSRAGVDRLFSYTNSCHAHAGDVVRIPFGRRITEGVVLHTSPTPPSPSVRRYRDILSIIQKKALAQEQLELAYILAKEYRAPWGSFLSSFLAWSVPSASPSPQPKDVTIHKSSLSERERTFVKKITENTRTIFIDPNEQQRVRRIGHALHRTLNAGESALVLFPDRISQERALDSISHLPFRNMVTALHGALTSRQKRDLVAQLTQPHQPHIIFGTRVALFTPFQNLRFVITESHHRQAHKQDFSQPRYDSRQLAHHLARIHHARILLSDGFLTSTLSSLARNRSWKLLSAPHKTKISPPRIINLYEDRSFTKNRAHSSPDPISPTLLNALREAKQQSKLSLIVCARRGMSAMSFCTACKKPLLCPNCQRALIAQASGSYMCLHCSYMGDIFTNCFHCHGMSFSHKTPGTQAVVSQLHKHMPHASIVRTDADSEYYASKRLRELAQKKRIDIVVGTPAILSRWPLRPPVCASIADAESFWQWPQYDAQERAYEIFSRTKNLVDPTVPSAQVFIQTTHPNHAIFNALQSQKASTQLLKSWLEEREALSYPPCARLITLTATHAKKEQSQKIAEVAQEHILTHTNDTAIISPLFTPLKRTNKKYSRRFVIKIPQLWYEPLPTIIIQALAGISPACYIDVDPTEIA